MERIHWNALKNYSQSMSWQMSFVESEFHYIVIVTSGAVALSAMLKKGSEECLDFETNFKSGCLNGGA